MPKSGVLSSWRAWTTNTALAKDVPMWRAGRREGVKQPSDSRLWHGGIERRMEADVWLKADLRHSTCSSMLSSLSSSLLPSFPRVARCTLARARAAPPASASRRRRIVGSRSLRVAVVLVAVIASPTNAAAATVVPHRSDARAARRWPRRRLGRREERRRAGRHVRARPH